MPQTLAAAPNAVLVVNGNEYFADSSGIVRNVADVDVAGAIAQGFRPVESGFAPIQPVFVAPPTPGLPSLPSFAFTSGAAAGSLLTAITNGGPGTTIASLDTSGVFAVSSDGTQLLAGPNYAAASIGQRAVFLSKGGQTTAFSVYLAASPIAPNAATSAVLQEDVRVGLTNTFSDTAGTVAATVGGKVAAVKDNSGNIAWTQATTANQPTLGQDATTGLYFLQFDGLATFMNRANKADVGTILAVYSIDKINAANGANSNPRGYYNGLLSAPSASGNGYLLYGLRNSTNTTPPQVADLANFTRVRSDGTQTSAYANPVIGAIDVLMMRTDDTNYELDRDGVPVTQGAGVATVGKVALGGTYAAVGCFLSSAGAAGSFLKGRVYSLHTWAGKLSDAEMAGVSQWAKNRIGRGKPTGKWIGMFFAGTGVAPSSSTIGAAEAGLAKAAIMVQTDDPTSLNYRASSSLTFNFNLAAVPAISAMSARDYGLAYDGSDIYVTHTGAFTDSASSKYGLQLSKLSAAGDHFTSTTVSLIDTTGAALKGQPYAPEFVKNQDGLIWYDANNLPAIVFHISASTTAQIQYIVQPVDQTWKTGGAWGTPTLITGTIPVGSIDSSIVVVGGVFHHFYANWGVTPNVIGYATATSLTGPYTPVGATDAFGFGGYYESPQPLYMGGNTWMMQVDNDGGGYFYATSTTGIAGPYSALSPVTAPFVPEHGNLIPTPAGW